MSVSAQFNLVRWVELFRLWAGNRKSARRMRHESGKNVALASKLNLRLIRDTRVYVYPPIDHPINELC